MRKMIIFFLCAFLAGSIAMASDTRVTTMGEVNNIVKDEANIWLYPHTLIDYPKLFNAEYSSGADFSSVGIHLPLSEGTSPKVLGFYFYENAPTLFGVDPNTGIVLFNQPTHHLNGSILPNHRLSAFYVQNIGGGPIGFNLDYTKASQESDVDGDATEVSNYSIDFLASGRVTEKIEIATGLSFWSYKDIDAAGDDTTNTTSGNLLYQLYGRYWLAARGKIVPVFHGGMAQLTQTINAAEYSDLMIELGLGLNYESREDVLIVTDFGFMYISEKTTIDTASATNSNFVLPYFRAGIDAKVFKWMDFRVGVSSFWNSEKYEGVANYSYVNTNTYLGAGFHWGDLIIDAQIQPEFLTNGPYFISGENTAGGIASRISATYWFD